MRKINSVVSRKRYKVMLQRVSRIHGLLVFPIFSRLGLDIFTWWLSQNLMAIIQEYFISHAPTFSEFLTSCKTLGVHPSLKTSKDYVLVLNCHLLTHIFLLQWPCLFHSTLDMPDAAFSSCLFNFLANTSSFTSNVAEFLGHWSDPMYHRTARRKPYSPHSSLVVYLYHLGLNVF